VDDAHTYLGSLRVQYELLPLAKAMGIDGASSMRKAELIEAIIGTSSSGR